MSHISSKTPASTSYCFFRNSSLKTQKAEPETLESSCMRVNAEVTEPLLEKKFVETKQTLLNQPQKADLLAILNEKHTVESHRLNTSFTLSAFDFLTTLQQKLLVKADEKMQISYSYSLIGSRAGSLFRSQICNDTDLLVECKVKIDPDYLKRFSCVKDYFSFNTKLILDQTRDDIELAVKELYDSSPDVTERRSITLKDVWLHFFTKRKFDNDPINSLEENSGNRYGIIHIGKTLEIKYTVEYEIADHVIKGLLNPCSFVQDDLRISLNEILALPSSELDISAYSIENPIEHVIKSLMANELLTEKPDGSKFFSHLTKLTLKEGVTRRSHIEKNFHLLLEGIDLREFECRLFNALKEKNSFEQLMCLINCYNLMLTMELKQDIFNSLSVVLEKQILDTFHERAKVFSVTLPQSTILEWTSLILLLTSDSTKKSFCTLESERASYQLICPLEPLKLILNLFKKGLTLDQLLCMYRTLIPSRSFKTVISDESLFIKILINQLKEHLSEIEMRIIAHFLLFNAYEIFEVTDLIKYLQESKDFYLRIRQQEFVSPLDGKIYPTEHFFKKIFIKPALPHRDIKIAEEHESKELTTSFIYSDYGLDEASKLTSEDIFKILELNKKAFDPYIDALSFKLLISLKEEDLNLNKALVVQRVFFTLCSLLHLEGSKDFYSFFIDEALVILNKVLSEADFSKVSFILKNLDDHFFAHLLLLLVQSESSDLKQLSFYLLKEAIDNQFAISSDSLKESTIELFLNCSDFPKEEIGLLNHIEDSQIYNDSVTLKLIVMAQKSLLESKPSEQLQKIHKTLHQSNGLLVDDERKNIFIINKLSCFLQNFAPTIKSRTELNKTKEILFLLKAASARANPYFDKLAAEIFAILLKVSIQSWPDLYMGLFFDAKKCKAFENLHFCHSITESFETFLSTLDDSFKKIFIKKITSVRSQEPLFLDLFLPSIEQMTADFLNKFDLVDLLKLSKELNNPCPPARFAALLQLKIETLIQSTSDELNLAIAALLEDEELKTLFEFDGFLKATQQLANELLLRTIRLNKLKSDLKVTQQLFILSLKLKQWLGFAPESDENNLFFQELATFLSQLCPETELINFVKHLDHHLSIFNQLNPQYSLSLKLILSTALKSTNLSFKHFGHRLFKEIATKNSDNKKTIAILYLSILSSYAEDNNTDALVNLFFKGIQIDLFDKHIPAGYCELALRLIFNTIFSSSSDPIPLEVSSRVIKETLSNESLKKELLLNNYLFKNLKINASIIKVIISTPSLSSFAADAYDLLKMSLLSLQNEYKFFQERVSDLDAATIEMHEKTISDKAIFLKNLINLFVKTPQMNLDIRKWLDLLNFLTTTPVDFFHNCREEKVDLIMLIMLALITDLKNLRAIDFSYERGEENKIRFTESLNQIKLSFENIMVDDFFLSRLITKYCIQIGSIMTVFQMGAQFDPSLHHFLLNYFERLNTIKTFASPFYQYQLVCINGALKGLQFLLEFKTPPNEEVLLKINQYALEAFSFLKLDDKLILKMYEDYVRLFLQLATVEESPTLISALFQIMTLLSTSNANDLQPIFKYTIERTCLTTSFYEPANELFKACLGKKIINASIDKVLFQSLINFLAYAKKKTSKTSDSTVPSEELSIKPVNQEQLIQLFKNYEELITCCANFSFIKIAEEGTKSVQGKISKIKSLLMKQLMQEKKISSLAPQFHETTQKLIDTTEFFKEHLKSDNSPENAPLFEQYIINFSFYLSKRTISLNTHVFYRIFGTDMMIARHKFTLLCAETIKSYADWLIYHGFIVPT